MMSGSRHRFFLAALAVLAVSCGDGGTDVDPVAVPVAVRKPSGADPGLAGQAISAFGSELFTAVRSESQPGENVTVSPASVAVALAMVEPGTVGDAQSQLRSLLHISDPVAFHASMNALEQALEARVPSSVSSDDDAGEVVVRIANAAYLHRATRSTRPTSRPSVRTTGRC